MRSILCLCHSHCQLHVHGHAWLPCWEAISGELHNARASSGLQQKMALSGSYDPVMALIGLVAPGLHSTRRMHGFQ